MWWLFLTPLFDFDDKIWLVCVLCAIKFCIKLKVRSYTPIFGLNKSSALLLKILEYFVVCVVLENGTNTTQNFIHEEPCLLFQIMAILNTSELVLHFLKFFKKFVVNCLSWVIFGKITRILYYLLDLFPKTIRQVPSLQRLYPIPLFTLVQGEVEQKWVLVFFSCNIFAAVFENLKYFRIVVYLDQPC